MRHLRRMAVPRARRDAGGLDRQDEEEEGPIPEGRISSSSEATTACATACAADLVDLGGVVTPDFIASTARRIMSCNWDSSFSKRTRFVCIARAPRDVGAARVEGEGGLSLLMGGGLTPALRRTRNGTVTVSSLMISAAAQREELERASEVGGADPGVGPVRPVDFSCLALLTATAAATAAATAGSRERPWPSAAAVAATVSVLVAARRACG